MKYDRLARIQFYRCLNNVVEDCKVECYTHNNSVFMSRYWYEVHRSGDGNNCNTHICDVIDIIRKHNSLLIISKRPGGALYSVDFESIVIKRIIFPQ